MLKNYESPEAVEIGKADLNILGEKGCCVWDQPTLSFIRSDPTAVDLDE